MRSADGASEGLVRVAVLTEGVGRVTLNRPGRRNAINAELSGDFDQAVDRLLRDGVRVAVLDAEGPAFCAGADLDDLYSAGTAVRRMMERIAEGSLYWVADVRGAARGAAVAVLSVCHHVISSPDATFGLPETARGFFPSDLITSLVSALGRRNAFDLAFTASPISAVDAQRAGLVSSVVPEPSAAEAVRTLAAKVAGMDPGALRVGLASWASVISAETVASV